MADFRLANALDLTCVQSFALLGIEPLPAMGFTAPATSFDEIRAGMRGQTTEGGTRPGPARRARPGGPPPGGAEPDERALDVRHPAWRASWPRNVYFSVSGVSDAGPLPLGYRRQLLSQLRFRASSVSASQSWPILGVMCVAKLPVLPT